MRLALYETAEARNAFYQQQKDSVSIPWAVITAWKKWKDTSIPSGPRGRGASDWPVGCVGYASDFLISKTKLVADSGVWNMLRTRVVPRIMIFNAYKTAKQYSNNMLLAGRVGPVILTLDNYAIEETGVAYALPERKYAFATGEPLDNAGQTQLLLLLGDAMTTSVIAIVLAYEQLVQGPATPPVLDG